MHFDIRTLLVAVALATAFCAAARVLLWWMHREMPGLGQWAVAGVLAFPALILIALHGVISNPWPLSLAQLLIVIALTITWDGFRRFLGRSPLPFRLWAIALVIAFGGILASYLTQSFMFRASSTTAVIALLSALIARELYLSTQPARTVIRVTSWVYAANAFFFLIRSFSVATHGQQFSILDPDGLAALSLLWLMGNTIMVTLAMVLMTGERLQRSLDYQASRDPLTGALNRRAFSMVAEKELALARRFDQPLSVMMLDLDHFKSVNDRLGHGGGDEVLCRFVSVAKRVLRSEDLFSRFGGEEFVALLPGANADQAMVVAERLRGAYERETADLRGQSIPFDLTVSAGVAEWLSGEDVDSVLLRADTALYLAKSGGRNRCALAENGAVDIREPGSVLNEQLGS